MRKFYCLWALLATLSTPVLAADSYTIDTAHSVLRFTVSHFVFLTTPGSFNKISGKVTLDHAAKTGLVDVTVDTGSIDTDHAARDDNLRSVNFFNVKTYPTALYQSNTIKFNGDVPGSVEGMLTLLGVTKPVTLTITSFQCETRPADNKEWCNTTASAKFKRSDFGMSYSIPLIGDEIKLVIELQAAKD